ncbi:hypothetical protein A2721_00080 [Candidatus Gottesmanbacteria bacterium RIFCSPHIGHO2_01_FULL_47_48]|uniref:Aminoacyl-tRNA hydrolase n=1 Tax=Candidatus Gottesmanbacteria bacterium RIFCSPHIGHO2_01_FULL_47_48 TaxID=1798381 RepID=A0A1F6A3G7_9BACT|nr:MAG: hypothetical protein A2721_00080 [Candidatus Gottesmanbacteria bacterium RIFCSPHIGHO2_01_FULL_47_48]
MKLVVGLGNPGEKFKMNRHNVGKVFVREFGDVGGFRVFETNCFMNESGRWVAEKMKEIWGRDWSSSANLSNLVIVHDDLDLPLGQFKIQFGVGPKVHNGVNSIEEALGAKPFGLAQGKDFWRVRIGVDARKKGEGRREKGEEYVLEDFTKEEMKVLEEVFPKIREELRKCL